MSDATNSTAPRNALPRWWAALAGVLLAAAAAGEQVRLQWRLAKLPGPAPEQALTHAMEARMAKVRAILPRDATLGYIAANPPSSDPSGVYESQKFQTAQFAAAPIVFTLSLRHRQALANCDDDAQLDEALAGAMGAALHKEGLHVLRRLGDGMALLEREDALKPGGGVGAGASDKGAGGGR